MNAKLRFRLPCLVSVGFLALIAALPGVAQYSETKGEIPPLHSFPGTPATFAGMVVKSFRYIANGSFSFSPSLNAVVGAEGLAITSHTANARAKSS